MEEEYYEEVETEIDEDLTAGDVLLGIGIVLTGCLVAALIFTLIRRTFKNVHLKIGDKIEIGVETKEWKKKS